MRKLLFDVCVNRRDTWPAFVSVRPGDFVSDHIAATSPDTAVLELARTLDRILVTEDFDFGDLIVGPNLTRRRPLPTA